jgi:hypothetical protein
MSHQCPAVMSSYKGINYIMKALLITLLKPNYFPKALSLNTNTLGLKDFTI